MNLRKKLSLVLSCVAVATLLFSGLSFALSYRVASNNMARSIDNRTKETLEVLSNGLLQEDCASMDETLTLFHYVLLECLSAQSYDQTPDWQAAVDDTVRRVLEERNGILNGSFILYTGDNYYGFQATSSECRSELEAAFQSLCAADPEYIGCYSDLREFLSLPYLSNYCLGENGVELVGFPLYNDLSPERVLLLQSDTMGMLIYQNSVELTGLENEAMLSDLHTYFRKALAVTIFSLAAIFAILLIAVFYLTDQVAAPVEQEQKESKENLARVEEEKKMLEELDRMKTEFLSDISHELKTPLTVISGYAQTASLSQDSDVSRDSLKKIASEANRMAFMVNQVLDMTRIEENRLKLELSGCQLADLITETVEVHFPILNKSGNTLHLDVPYDLPEIQIDSSRIQRVLVNLLSNALKATSHGRITISCHQNGDFLETSVSDTGCGMSKELQARLFQRFSKGDNTGTGLGLYICKYLIEEHGGTIRAESAEGQGSTFTFTLPINSKMIG